MRKLRGGRTVLAKREAGLGKVGQGRAGLGDSALGRRTLLGTLLLYSVRTRGEAAGAPAPGDREPYVSTRQHQTDDSAHCTLTQLAGMGCWHVHQ